MSKLTYLQQAFAWHPWSSGILCIGGGKEDASLALWNVNVQRQIGLRKIPKVLSVESMMFNKLSGELVVHCLYIENEKLRSTIVVLASLDRVVDAIPLDCMDSIESDRRVYNLLWSPDHLKFGMKCFNCHFIDLSIILTVIFFKI